MPKTFRFRTTSRRFNPPAPSRPSLVSTAPEEALTGYVNDMKASAAEERLAKALDKANIYYLFRYTVGAPRGLPGWKELDFLISTKGLIYALEVDSAFTHQGKANADVLHDAIILNDRELQAYGTVFPSVLHVDGEAELAGEAEAQAYVKRQFGKV